MRGQSARRLIQAPGRAMNEDLRFGSNSVWRNLPDSMEQVYGVGNNEEKRTASS